MSAPNGATISAHKAEALGAARAIVAELGLTPDAACRRGLNVNRDGEWRSAADLLALPGVGVKQLAMIWPELAGVRAEVAEQLEIDARYAGYLGRQAADIKAFRRDESLLLPDDLDYAAVGALSTEVRGKLQAARPPTLGAAARISGVTPASLTALLAHVRRGGASAYP